MDLKVFTNADWIGNLDDRKSTSGGVFSLDKRFVSWIRKKKNCTSQYIVEVEYVAVVINYSHCLVQTIVGRHEGRNQSTNCHVL